MNALDERDERHDSKVGIKMVFRQPAELTSLVLFTSLIMNGTRKSTFY